MKIDKSDWNSRPSGWISVKDKLPELFVEVLVVYKNSDDEWAYNISERFHFNGKTEIKWSAMAGQTPDYWMPLPELSDEIQPFENGYKKIPLA